MIVGVWEGGDGFSCCWDLIFLRATSNNSVNSGFVIGGGTFSLVLLFFGVLVLLVGVEGRVENVDADVLFVE